MNEKPKPRDGVWTSDGLSADFRCLYTHPHNETILRVQTAAGEYYAHEHELHWDNSPQER